LNILYKKKIQIFICIIYQISLAVLAFSCIKTLTIEAVPNTPNYKLQKVETKKQQISSTLNEKDEFLEVICSLTNTIKYTK